MDPEPAPRPTPQHGGDAERVHLVLGTVTASGGLRHPDAFMVLRAALPELRSACRDRLDSEPGITGELRASLTVAADGTVTAVVFGAGSVADEPLRRAVRRVLEQLRFAAVSGGGPARVTVALVLRA